MTRKQMDSEPKPGRATQRWRWLWCCGLPAVALVLFIGGSTIYWAILSAPVTRLSATAWYYDGQQELMSVMRCKMPPNPLFFWLSRSIEPQLGTYLRHDGQWTLAPTFGKRSAIIASNGVMLAGPKAPEFDPADTCMLLQNGQTRKLFSGQDVLDAARPLLKAGKPVGLMPVDASFDASTGHVALSMNYYGNLDQDVKHYTCNPVEFLWDGTKLAMVTPQQLPALHHVFAGGYARLSYDRPFKPSLVITLDSAPGMPGSKHAIDLQDPANDGYTRVAGFVGDSVWMVDGLEQKAVRRDLRSWQIVEQRDLSATVRTIPRKLLRQMESMR